MNTSAGAWIIVSPDDRPASHGIVPPGEYAVVVQCNDVYFTVDKTGNISGDPKAVEREVIVVNSKHLIARAALGLARMAQRVNIWGG